MKWRGRLIRYAPMVLAAALILYFAIEKEQTFIKTLPTLITLVVQLLTVSANRYAFLLGSANSVLYGISYLSEGLYFSMISALLINAPIQLFSFLHWKKHANGGYSAPLKVLNMKKRIGGLLTIPAGWAVCYFGLARFFAGATYPLLDTLCFTLGLVVSLLSAFRFVEGQYISICSTLIQVVMWSMIAAKEPGSFNYVIISVYNCFRVTEAAIAWTGNYLKQRKSKEASA